MKKYTNKKIYHNMGKCFKKIIINLILVFIISVIFMLITLHLFFYTITQKKNSTKNSCSQRCITEIIFLFKFSQYNKYYHKMLK